MASVKRAVAEREPLRSAGAVHKAARPAQAAALSESQRDSGPKPRVASLRATLGNHPKNSFNRNAVAASPIIVLFRFNPAKEPREFPAPARTMQLSGERARLACGVRRPAEHLRPTIISPPND